MKKSWKLLIRLQSAKAPQVNANDNSDWYHIISLQFQGHKLQTFPLHVNFSCYVNVFVTLFVLNVFVHTYSTTSDTVKPPVWFSLFDNKTNRGKVSV